jgi:RimJ/RimL family protein N-acetyltransferase
MTEHLGGPETDEALRKRQERYVANRDSETEYCFKVVVDGVNVGNVNFWDREWKGEQVYEMGWGIVPEHQGRGLASEAVKQAIETARQTRRRSAIHAFPSIENGPSNGLCRKVGFTFQGEEDFEYPKGHWMRCNDWRFSFAD